jgi:hypothetical protein
MYEANLFFACINTLHVFTELCHLSLFINFIFLIIFTYDLTQGHGKTNRQGRQGRQDL